jgi:sulfur relay (sulfurtransferase) complex TusBCD TusD component (DsrE family)
MCVPLIACVYATARRGIQIQAPPVVNQNRAKTNLILGMALGRWDAIKAEYPVASKLTAHAGDISKICAFAHPRHGRP